MSCPSVGVSGLVTYMDFVRANSDYLYRPDEPGLDITGALTLGCWAWFDTQSTGVETGLMSKWYTTGNQRAYLLHKSAANVLTFSASNDGTAEETIGAAVADYVINRWFFIVGRFTPNVSVSLFVNGTWYNNIVTPIASIYNSSEPFYIGCYNRGNFLDGRACHAFLCANALPNRFIEAMYAHSRAMFKSM